MMKKLQKAVNWLQKNSEKLGKQYKDQWLAIGPSGVKSHSKSYAKLSNFVDSKEFLIIKVPKNPKAAYVYWVDSVGAKTFPFVTFEYGAPARPLVPFDFPKGKNVYCLIDSGAIISESFRHHEELEFKQKFTDNKCEGVCGKNCLEIIGVTQDVAVKIDGIAKEFKLAFHVMGQDAKVQTPIIGQNFFEQADILFRKEKGTMQTIIYA